MDIRRQVLQLDQLPNPPALAVELVELTSHPDVKISRIAALIERDGALAARVLKLCNSDLFDLGYEMESIERATVMVGIHQMRMLALGFMVVGAPELNRENCFDHQHFRTRASVAAASARSIAGIRLPMLAGEAFVGGLVVDVGVLLLQQMAPTAYKGVVQLSTRSGKRLQDAEESLVGVTHMEAGETLLRAWGFPNIIHEPVGVHHCPQTFEGEDHIRELVDIVAAASEITNLFCEPNKSENMDRVRGICSVYLQQRDDEIDELLTQVGVDARETASILKADPSTTLDYDRVQQQACRESERLARVS